MRQERIDKLIELLNRADNWLSAASLARLLGVSERSVRSYITKAKEQGVQVESSRAGYRLAPNQRATSSKRDTKTQLPERAVYILSRVLSSPAGVSVFDLAEELHVSDSTVLNVAIPQLRAMATRFGVAVTTNHFIVQLAGDEHSIRRLAGYVAMHESNEYFSSLDTLQTMFPQFNVRQLRQALDQACRENEVLPSSYALNVLLAHLFVIATRLQSGSTLETHHAQDKQPARLSHASHFLVDFFQNELDVEPTGADREQIAALETLWIGMKPAAQEQLDHFFEPLLVHTLYASLDELCRRYVIPSFEDSFITQLMFHVDGACKRARQGKSYPNPIAAQIKRSHAPIYDMAVYLAHLLEVGLGVSLVDDEIGFIAFHLGAYLETHKNREQPITCVVIAERYRDAPTLIASALTTEFGDALEVLSVVGTHTPLNELPVAELVVSTANVQMRGVQTVRVGPLPTRADLEHIREAMELIRQKRRREFTRTLLAGYFSPELFLRNMPVDSSEGCIRLLADHCLAAGRIGSGFVDDVLERERLSSTAFTEEVAVPHAMGAHASSSFICVLHNDAPIAWGAQHVRFVLLVGLALEDIHLFQDILDVVVDVFSSPDRVSLALASNDYDEFLDALIGGAAEG